MTKVHKVVIVIEQDSSGSLLVVAAVARVEHLDSDLAVLVGVPGGDGIAASLTKYPEAPVPKSMAMTCVKELSSLSRAMIQIITVSKLSG